MGIVANFSGPILAYFDHTVEHPTPEEEMWIDIHIYCTDLFIAA